MTGDQLDLLKIVIPILLTMVGVVLAAAVYLDVAPRLELKVLPRILGTDQVLLCLRVEVLNTSRVLLKHDQKVGSRLQVLRYPAAEAVGITEFVPFSKEAYDAMDAPDRPSSWGVPQEVLKTTSHWYPGDKAVVERVLCVGSADEIVQIGLQVHGHVSWWVHLLLRLRGVHRKWGDAERWTTTAIVWPSSRTRHDG